MSQNNLSKPTRLNRPDDHLPLDFPKVNPVTAVADFEQSKIEEKQIRYVFSVTLIFAR